MTTCGKDYGDGLHSCTLEAGHAEPRDHQDAEHDAAWREGWGLAQLDTSSSASSQHYIDTGRWLLVGEEIG